MPRKKKEQIIEQKQENTSSVGYKGEVDIKVVRSGKVIRRIKHKNTGKTPMFYFLAKCLQGSYEESLRPNYINLVNKSGSNDNPTYKILTSISTPCSSARLTEKDGDYGASMEFVVPAVYVLAGNVLKVNALRLYNSKDANNVKPTTEYSAEVLLDENDSFYVTEEDRINTSILVTWTLYLTNSVASEN